MLNGRYTSVTVSVKFIKINMNINKIIIVTGHKKRKRNKTFIKISTIKYRNFVNKKSYNRLKKNMKILQFREKKPKYKNTKLVKYVGKYGICTPFPSVKIRWGQMREGEV